MKLLQVIQKKLLQHKYAINTKLLGDSSELAWSNLGFWQNQASYIVACEKLADHLAQSIHLNSKDRVLDLGSGYGASLLHWQKKYHVYDIESVELQEQCVNHITKYFKQTIPVYCDSYLNLKKIPFQKKFDAMVCIDSAYHSPLNLFLEAINAVLNSNARIGFHYLMLSEQWTKKTQFQKYEYALLLKAVDIQIKNLNSRAEIVDHLHDFKFKNIKITDLSKPVFWGFSKYIEEHFDSSENNLDILKIKMTAKLCRKLFEDGLIQYVLVTAQYEE